MKTLGIIGGMSWESTLEYYRLINKWVKENLWWHHSAKILLSSVDFQEIKDLQYAWNWEKAGNILAWEAKKLEYIGADNIILATNTMHKVAPVIEQSISIPFIHIADSTGEKIVSAHYKNVWLLWTKFTMEDDFYKKRLEEKYNLSILIPEESERNDVHTIIYEELCLWKVREQSRERYEEIIRNLKSRGAECIILWCTEICLLISQKNSVLPVFDTTAIHAETAVLSIIS